MQETRFKSRLFRPSSTGELHCEARTSQQCRGCTSCLARQTRIRKNMFVFAFIISLMVSATVQETVIEGLPTNRPLVVAHRGSSGMRPEHTVEAYQLAIQQGADVIECDVVLTKDLKLICSHDVSINSTSDVHLHPEFNDRVRTYMVDGSRVTDYFTVDFTLEEIKTLGKVQQNSRRDQSYNGVFPLASFDEYVAVAKNSSNPRTIGIYPETKSSPFLNNILTTRNHTTTFEDILLESLTKHGYQGANAPCFIQSFYPTSLQYLAPKTDLPLIYLTSVALSDEFLGQLSVYCYGVGPSKNTIVRVVNGNILEKTDFVDRIHAYGLKVHPYTFRNEYSYLAWDYGADPYREYELFMEIGIDGFFTDFPWSLANYLNMKTTSSSNNINLSSCLFSLCSLLVVICVWLNHGNC